VEKCIEHVNKENQKKNQETLATLGTRHRMKTSKTKNIAQKTKKMSNTDPTKKPGVCEG